MNLFKNFLCRPLPAIVISTLLTVVFVSAWTEPSAVPPANNTAAPLNVSNQSQYKSGALGVGGVFHGYADAIFDGNVSIGTTTPSAKLSLGGIPGVDGIGFPDGTLQTTAAGPGSNLIHTNGNSIYVGANAGNYSTSTGWGNSSLGYDSLRSLTSGTNNSALGDEALMYNTTGGDNVAIGRDSLHQNVSGGGNTAIGINALYNSLQGFNTAVGSQSLFGNTTGYNNTAFGVSALNKNTTGYGNIALGFQAGGSTSNSNPTGFYNIFIGYAAGAGTTSTLSNAIAIGKNALVNQSNSMALGGTGIDAIKVGIGTASPAYTLDVAGKTNASELCIAGSCKNSWSAVGGGAAGGSSAYIVGASVESGVGSTIKVAGYNPVLDEITTCIDYTNSDSGCSAARLARIGNWNTYTQVSSGGVYRPRGMVRIGSYIYVSEITSNSPYVVNITRYDLNFGGATYMSVTGATYLGRMATDGTYIYILDSNTIYKYSISGTSATLISTITLAVTLDMSYYSGFSTDGTYFYGVDSANRRTIYKINMSGGTVASWYFDSPTNPRLLFNYSGVLWAVYPISGACTAVGCSYQFIAYNFVPLVAP